MKASSTIYFISDAVKSFRRNKTISMASIVTLSAALFIMGILLLFMKNVNLMMDNIQSGIEVKVFLADDASVFNRNDIEQALRNIPGVGSVQFETKEEALEKFMEQFDEESNSLLSAFDSSNNPLPNAYIVQLDNPEASNEVINAVKILQGVESIGNDKQLIDSIIAVSKGIRWIGSVIFLLMVAVSLFLIGNTIRLTVYSRRKEIGIMKFVGATDFFIRGPFIIEGAIIGLLGSLIATTFLYYGYNLFYVKLTESLLIFNVLKPSYILNTILLQFIVSGVLIGSLASSLSLYKFLKV
jgi:cell division transport system permease protein